MLFTSLNLTLLCGNFYANISSFGACVGNSVAITKIFFREEEKFELSFMVCLNKVSIQLTHDTVFIGHNISDARLLIPLRKDIIVPKVTK